MGVNSDVRFRTITGRNKPHSIVRSYLPIPRAWCRWLEDSHMATEDGSVINALSEPVQHWFHHRLWTRTPGIWISAPSLLICATRASFLTSLCLSFLIYNKKAIVITFLHIIYLQFLAHKCSTTKTSLSSSLEVLR